MLGNFHQSQMRALPPPVAGALAYVGIASLGLLGLRYHLFYLWVSPLRYGLPFNYAEDGGLRWISCVVSSLLVVLLWAHWRGTSREALQTALFLGTSVLVLLTHFAVVYTLDAFPHFVLIPV